MKQKQADQLMEQKGFTLVELVVVVTIVGVLAAFAIPQYQGYTRRSNRTDGRAALMVAVQQVERYRSTNMTYVGATIDASSEYGLYSLALAATADTFTVTATATGPQAADTACTPLTLNHLGVKTPAGCW